MQRLTHVEWRWLIIASLLAMMAFSFPYLFGLMASTPAKPYGGFIFGLEDMYSYIAKMRYGAGGAWMFELMYTTEPHNPARLIYVHYLLLGKLTAVVTGKGAIGPTSAFVLAYHATRIIGGLVLLTMIYQFVSHFFTEIPARRTAWALSSLGGGLGYLVILTSLAVGIDAPLPIDFYIPEAFTFLLLAGLPHLSIARALLLAGWLLLFDAFERSAVLPAILSGMCWLGMGIIVPFYAALLGVLIVCWLIGLLMLRRKLLLSQLGMVLIAGSLPAMILFVNSVTFATNPIFAEWAAQNYLPSPVIWDYLAGYGLFILLGLVGIRHVFQVATEKHVLLFIWPIAAITLAYMPIGVQRRLLEGAIIPMSILAVLGFQQAVSKFSALRMPAIAVLLIAVTLNPFLFIVGAVNAAGKPIWPIYNTREELAAYVYLAETAPPGSRVLSTCESGNLLPAHALVRVYCGHGPETIDSPLKRELAVSFFTPRSVGGMTNSERNALLDEAMIDFVWIGGPEVEAGCGGGSCLNEAELALSLIYASGQYRIYRRAY